MGVVREGCIHQSQTDEVPHIPVAIKLGFIKLGLKHLGLPTTDAMKARP